MRHFIHDTGDAHAEGVMYADAGAGCWEEIAIRVNFGPDYPGRPPTVYEEGGRWQPDPDRHIVDGGEFCLWLARVDMPDVSTPEGLEDFLWRLLPFLRDQLVFDDIGRWPGQDWPHGWRAAYAEHLIERLQPATPQAFRALWPLVLGASQRPDRGCPCGSRLPYGRCHRRHVEALRWVGNLPERNDLPSAVEERLHDAA